MTFKGLLIEEQRENMPFIHLSPITKKRLERFKTIKRGYYSFWILCFLILLSFGAEFLMNSKAILVVYKGEFYFPTFSFYSGETFGESYKSEAKYRELYKKFAESGEGTVIMPLIPYDPYEYDFSSGATPPAAPDDNHLLGTDDRGRDVLVRLFYAFRIAILFSLTLTITGYAIGIVVGAIMGYFGGWVDLLVQRFIEIWSSIPFLYLCIIFASIFRPSFLTLLGILSLFTWISMTYYTRTEVYREKAKDYCSAARSIGCSHRRIILKHLLPNSLVPVVSYFPFAIVANINALTSLDFLGYGLPAPTPSWGELLKQGLENLDAYWITGSAFIAIVITLLLITFIGEAIRESFDPKQYAKYQ